MDQPSLLVCRCGKREFAAWQPRAQQFEICPRLRVPPRPACAVIVRIGSGDERVGSLREDRAFKIDTAVRVGRDELLFAALQIDEAQTRELDVM